MAASALTAVAAGAVAAAVLAAADLAAADLAAAVVRAGLGLPSAWAVATAGQMAAAMIEPATARVSPAGLRFRVGPCCHCAASGLPNLGRWPKAAWNVVGLWCRDKMCLWSSAFGALTATQGNSGDDCDQERRADGTRDQGDGGTNADPHAGCCQPSSLPSDTGAANRNGHKWRMGNVTFRPATLPPAPSDWPAPA